MPEEFALIFRTAQGDQRLLARRTDSVMDICRRYGIPTTQVSTYLLDATGTLLLTVKPFTPLEDYVGNATLVMFPNRNIDYGFLLGGEEVVHERVEASAWLRGRRTAPGVAPGFVTEMLTPDMAKALVAEQVREALASTAQADEPLVVGVSGGGDSNALLGALVTSELVSKANILPVMMMGIPDWDKGVDRARSICAEHGLHLQVVSEGEAAARLGFAGPGTDWVTAFEQAFPGDDLEVLGVYAIRRVLESVALERGARRIVIGSNLEDCLSDVFYFLCKGQIPFPKPCGRMGRVEILYPLWLTPKAVLDGCYPKFSRENYEARFPSRLPGRAYFYYLAQMMVDAYPGAAQDMLRGGRSLSDTFFEALPFEEEFQTPVLSPIPLPVRHRLRKLFASGNSV